MAGKDPKKESISPERWEWSRLLRTKDWWAVWLGMLLLSIGSAIYFPKADDIREKLEGIEARYSEHAMRTDKFKTISFYRMSDEKQKVKAKDGPAGRFLSKLLKKPREWSGNPLEAFFLGEEKAADRRQTALVKYERAQVVERASFDIAAALEKAAETLSFEDEDLNRRADSAISKWRNNHMKVLKLEKDAKIKSYNQVGYIAVLGIAFALFFGFGIKIMGESSLAFVKGFGFIFGVALVAYVCAGESVLKYYGIGYAPWAIALGLFINNTVGAPKWVRPAVQTEYYIKTGLVLLGAEILFEKILFIGAPGVFVAWVVTPIVWLTTYWFGQRVVGIASKRLNATICSDMSVCGISAAIATAEACRAKDEELTIAVGLSQIFTAVMGVVLPLIITLSFPLDKQIVLGGAWMGGTIDSTGSVTAASAILGEKALYIAATIKMIQNILIGVIAFFVAIHFTVKVESEETNHRMNIREIWNRFPKFVLGFMASSIIFSHLYSYFNAQTGGMGYSMIDQGVVKGMADLFRGWFFCFSFVSIGLSINFRNLRKHFAGGKPLILYVVGQSFNLILTLVVAYVMFYLAFPRLTAAL